MLNVNDVNQIYLGCQGENLARTIVIDVKPWLVAYPSGTAAIWHKRNGDATPSATGAQFDPEAGTLTWKPTSTDTYVFGEGEAEIRLSEGSVVKKSRKIRTDVAKAVTESGTPLGSEWQDYLDAIQRAAGISIIKNGMIRLAINSSGHLIFSYTDEVPVAEDESDSTSTSTQNDTVFTDLDLGPVDAYAEAVAAGYTGTRAEWLLEVGSVKENAQSAAGSATSASGSATAAAGSATSAAASAADALNHTQSVIEDWLENNIDPETGYALDRTLALSNAAAPADMAGEIKGAITTVTGKNIIAMTEGKVVYIQNNQDNDLTPSSSQLYRCAVVQCSAGDVFTINATGKTAGRPWAFVDINGRIVDGKAAEYSNSDVVVTNLVVTAPSGVSYLVVNDRYSGGVSIYGENINKDITDLTDNVLYNTVTPFDFGAKGDGVTDDTTALQNCINYAVANNCNIQIPRAVYLTSGITITGYCNIFGNGATLKYGGSNSSTGYVLRVSAPSVGLRGVVRDINIDCNSVAKSGLKVDVNINVLDFEHIQITNVYTNGYGIFLSDDDSPTSAQGRYKNIDIRCNVRSNSARGLYLLSHDAYFYDIKCVNCRYGAWSEVLACFVNFHPFNTYAELMTNSIGLYSTGLTFMTNSYIDTFAKCFGGTGFISIDALEVFWSTGYYTDESVGDSTTRPVIFDPGLRVFNLKGMRVYPPRGRTVQKSNFTSDPSSFYLYNNPRQGNVLEGVSNVPTRQYASETLTTETGVTDRYTKLYRYDEMIVFYTELEVSGLTTTSYKDLATVPSNSKPKTDKSWICAARNSQTASNRTCVEVTLNASSGKLSARAIFGNLSDANKIVISQEYKVASD